MIRGRAVPPRRIRPAARAWSTLPARWTVAWPRGYAGFLLLAVAAASTLAVHAADIRVGTDVPTIGHAIKAARPGDTIHLEPKVYRDYAGFHGKKGEKGSPITLDGHGATLEGSDPLDPARWREVSPGLYAADDLLPRLDAAVIGRWFFLFDGRMNLMGRTSKGRSAPLKKPEDLQPGEWTFVQAPARPDAKPGQIFGSFFIRLAEGTSLAAANISVPVRSAGVQFSGDNAFLVVRNLTATHPYNDGFNIHGDCRDCVFENIRAIECGDDGISAHESAEYRVDGLVSIGNSTGITDTGTARTSYRNVFIAGCVGFDLYFLDEGRYTITDALVLSSAQHPLVVSGRDRGECRLTLDNVLIRRSASPHTATVAARGVLDARHCTFENLDVRGAGTVTWDDCIIDGRPLPRLEARGADESALRRLAPAGFAE